jgi:hypothetical protein
MVSAKSVIKPEITAVQRMFTKFTPWRFFAQMTGTSQERRGCSLDALP